MSTAFMTNKKSPKVSIVMGNVRITSIGLTINLNSDNTIATQSEVTKPSTETPGNIFARMSTAMVVNMILKIDFIMLLIKQIEYQKKKMH